MFRKFLNPWLGGLLLVLTTTGNVSATSIDPVSLEDATREAGLIFQGTVTKIESRIATDMGSNYSNKRYGFVTFRIQRFIKGEVEGNGTTITLPFESCFAVDPHKQPNMSEKPGDVMDCGIVGMPTFEVGESDILFVQGNYVDQICPLVGWWQGRFSIINNKIYPVAWLTKEGGIDLTAPYGLEEEQEAEKLGKALPQEAKKHNWKPPQGAKRLDPDDFAKVIQRMLQDLQQTKGMKKAKLLPPPVRSADFNDPIYYGTARRAYEQQQKAEAIFEKTSKQYAVPVEK